MVSLNKVDVNRNSYKFELKWPTDFNWSIKFTTLIDSCQLYSILNFEIRLTSSGCLKVDEFRVHQVMVLKLTLKTPWHFFNLSSIAVFPNNFDFVKKKCCLIFFHESRWKRKIYEAFFVRKLLVPFCDEITAITPRTLKIGKMTT